MMSSHSKILFLHGLDSSKESTKFHAIDAEKKYCIEVDYRNLNFKTVEDFYHDTIDKIKPDLLIGHSLGGYWALRMSQSHRIPTIIANPSLSPDFRADYPAINEHDLEHDIPQIAYIELGDEILDMYAATSLLETYMQIDAVEGGHHRLAQPENLNRLIEYMEQTFISR
ncbi:YqiA/YcfP family alpha/beta fold hydrolase [Acinetobacter rongchengensis]|uniref:Alpha/beta fold hydrolase n=1 Tax=Acinetobacter rongchengensis TaxID=2419601 RepID=A0A3A8FAL7_9GAMM|nr:YqiA/YcfP family alpha/beta fold hydrolase [Acinetobacter rongchengensis]RKG40060.1 alpha/beta fold hydrolase [Acinetobacter rongchengensis]